MAIIPIIVCLPVVPLICLTVIDEQLIMNQTSHYSKEGVRYIRELAAKLNETTSDVSNGVDARDKKKEVASVNSKASVTSGKEKHSVGNEENCIQPVLQITGTINFGSIPRLQ